MSLQIKHPKENTPKKNCKLNWIGI
jgi:hypothetical protein